ncbi:unnamed protein product [Brassica napus]|uniref:NYN domain-containing protein n=2 Tax=Brassica TaxID=3705 RepID=M4DD54_BRACM|nr:unnamed protein product [Brassica napus]
MSFFTNEELAWQFFIVIMRFAVFEYLRTAKVVVLWDLVECPGMDAVTASENTRLALKKGRSERRQMILSHFLCKAVEYCTQVSLMRIMGDTSGHIQFSKAFDLLQRKRYYNCILAHIRIDLFDPSLSFMASRGYKVLLSSPDGNTSLRQHSQEFWLLEKLIQGEGPSTQES